MKKSGTTKVRANATKRTSHKLKDVWASNKLYQYLVNSYKSIEKGQIVQYKKGSGEIGGKKNN